MQHTSSLLATLAVATFGSAPAFAQWSTQSLSVARSYPAAVTIDDLALFAGGRFSNNLSPVVDVYDDATGSWTTAALSLARTNHAATVVRHYALFAGGSDSFTTSTDVVDVYDASVGPPTDPGAWSTVALTQARFALAATTAGDKAFFAGGGLGGVAAPTGVSDVVDIYDASVGPPSDPNAWSVATLSHPRGGLAADSAGGHAVFAGGVDFGGVLDTVDIYDCSTGVWSTAVLSEARLPGVSAAASAGTRIYFAGGGITQNPVVNSDRVDIYDAQTATWSTASLSLARNVVAATAVGNKVIFAGGATATGAVDIVDILDMWAGTWSSASSLSQARFDLGATTVGAKALFAGGSSGPNMPQIGVDIYDDAIGATYCSPAVANSTGLPATILAQGFPGSAAQGCTLLTANQLPQQGFGYFLNSLAQGFTANPGGSQGDLCLDGAIGRYAATAFNSGVTGRATLQLNLANTPTPLGAVSITAGQTWNFQAWYRDNNPGPTSNFTDAVSVTFL